MGQGQGPAAAFTQTVGRHQVQPEITGVVVLQITEFAHQIETALAHERRRQGRVPVRCDVPVIGNRNLHPIDIVQSESRWHETGLALVTQRKADVGNRQNRHAFEAERGTARYAHIFGGIHLQRGGTQNPVRHPARPGHASASGQTGIADNRSVLVDEINAVRFTMGVVGKKIITGLLEEAFKRVNFELQQRALENIAAAVDANFPAGFGQIVDLVVLQPIRPD